MEDSLMFQFHKGRHLSFIIVDIVYFRILCVFFTNVDIFKE